MKFSFDLHLICWILIMFTCWKVLLHKSSDVSIFGNIYFRHLKTLFHYKKIGKRILNAKYNEQNPKYHHFVYIL